MTPLRSIVYQVLFRPGVEGGPEVKGEVKKGGEGG